MLLNWIWTTLMHKSSRQSTIGAGCTYCWGIKLTDGLTAIIAMASPMTSFEFRRHFSTVSFHRNTAQVRTNFLNRILNGFSPYSFKNNFKTDKEENVFHQKKFKCRAKDLFICHTFYSVESFIISDVELSLLHLKEGICNST